MNEQEKQAIIESFREIAKKVLDAKKEEAELFHQLFHELKELAFFRLLDLKIRENTNNKVEEIKRDFIQVPGTETKN